MVSLENEGYLRNLGLFDQGLLKKDFEIIIKKWKKKL